MARKPRIRQKGKQQRAHHKEPYYTETAWVLVSPEVKQGLIEIAEMEGRTLSWVVAEVFRFYFGLKDDTQYLGLKGGQRLRKTG